LSETCVSLKPVSVQCINDLGICLTISVTRRQSKPAVAAITFRLACGLLAQPEKSKTSSVHDHFGTWGGPLRYIGTGLLRYSLTCTFYQWQTWYYR